VQLGHLVHKKPVFLTPEVLFQKVYEKTEGRPANTGLPGKQLSNSSGGDDSGAQ